MALTNDDTGEHQAIAIELGGFRQAFELWVCHVQLPAVELTERERQVLATRPLGELPGLRPRVDRLRELSHLTWHWVEAPPARQFEGDRYQRLEARLSVTDGVWLRPAHRVAGWVPDGGERAMTPVDVIGFYATRQAYRGELWEFATGDTPDLARQAVDELLTQRVDEWRRVVATVDAAQAALTVELPRSRRDTPPADGWSDHGVWFWSAEDLVREQAAEWAREAAADRDARVVKRVTELEAETSELRFPFPGGLPTTGCAAVVAWRAGQDERPGWRRLLDQARTGVTAWVSRLHWRRQA
jgi:hypothetical protein